MAFRESLGFNRPPLPIDSSDGIDLLPNMAEVVTRVKKHKESISKNLMEVLGEGVVSRKPEPVTDIRAGILIEVFLATLGGKALIPSDFFKRLGIDPSGIEERKYKNARSWLGKSLSRSPKSNFIFTSLPIIGAHPYYRFANYVDLKPELSIPKNPELSPPIKTQDGEYRRQLSVCIENAIKKGVTDRGLRLHILLSMLDTCFTPSGASVDVEYCIAKAKNNGFPSTYISMQSAILALQVDRGPMLDKEFGFKIVDSNDELWQPVLTKPLREYPENVSDSFADGEGEYEQLEKKVIEGRRHFLCNRTDPEAICLIFDCILKASKKDKGVRMKDILEYTNGRVTRAVVSFVIERIRRMSDKFPNLLGFKISGREKYFFELTVSDDDYGYVPSPGEFSVGANGRTSIYPSPKFTNFDPDLFTELISSENKEINVVTRNPFYMKILSVLFIYSSKNFEITFPILFRQCSERFRDAKLSRPELVRHMTNLKKYLRKHPGIGFFIDGSYGLSLTTPDGTSCPQKTFRNWEDYYVLKEGNGHLDRGLIFFKRGADGWVGLPKILDSSTLAYEELIRDGWDPKSGLSKRNFLYEGHSSLFSNPNCRLRLIDPSSPGYADYAKVLSPFDDNYGIVAIDGDINRLTKVDKRLLVKV